VLAAIVRALANPPHRSEITHLRLQLIEVRMLAREASPARLADPRKRMTPNGCIPPGIALPGGKDGNAFRHRNRLMCSGDRLSDSASRLRDQFIIVCVER
jgi:hypothetical protein